MTATWSEQLTRTSQCLFYFLQASLSNGSHFKFVKKVLDPYDPRNLYSHIYSFYHSRRNPRWVENIQRKRFLLIYKIFLIFDLISRKMKFKYNVFTTPYQVPNHFPIKIHTFYQYYYNLHVHEPYYRFAFFSEHNPVSHVSDHTYNDNKLHQEEEEDEDGML